MNTTMRTEVLTLRARTASELMAKNPMSIRADATTAEALSFFTKKGITAAPVIDAAGRPIGVLSRSDLLVHHRETALPPSSGIDCVEERFTSEPQSQRIEGDTNAATVAELMTPAVFSVAPDTPVRRVVEDMLALRVHRLFVVDDGGFLVGVISAMDVLRYLD